MARDAARTIWVDTPRSAVSNSTGATAQAVVVPGGYRITATGQKAWTATRDFYLDTASRAARAAGIAHA